MIMKELIMKLRAVQDQRGQSLSLFVLVIMGGIFVIETLSVMLQVASFKLTGRRIFRMAPIHHHFEHLGWSEPTVVIRFWIVSFVLALAGLKRLPTQTTSGSMSGT